MNPIEISNLKQSAQSVVNSGCSVLAVGGDKLPVGSWKVYQERSATTSEIDRWFQNPVVKGVAGIAGKVSGNLEIIDVDEKYSLDGNLWNDFKKLIVEHDSQLYKRLVIAETINGGVHIFFRHKNATVLGNHHLAKRPTTDEEKQTEKEKKGSFSKFHALIETRGEGGYVVLPPTHGYKFIQGDLLNVPIISDDERLLLYMLARSFDQMPLEEDYREKKAKQDYSGLSPFDDYNQRGDVISLLESRGWRVASSRGNFIYLKRPGMTDSKWSATLFKNSKIFYVFSTSTEFESEKGYTPSGVYTLLEHNSDYSAASKRLYVEGYGERKPERKKINKQRPSQQNADSQTELSPLRAVRMSDIQAEEISWLWNPFLALGTFNLLEGEEGIGKTFLVCAIASAIGMGKGLPNVEAASHIKPSNVLLISAEDSLSHVLKPRLDAMRAPCERIIAIDEPFSLDRDGIVRLSFSLAEYEPKLVVIDPLFSYTGKINLDRDNDIRAVTDELKRLAEKYNCCIVGIRHIGKTKGFGDSRNAGLNGVGWRASARSVLLIGKNPDNDKQKALCQTKNNLAPKFEKSLGFEIISGQFFWTGDSTLTAETMLSSIRSENSEEKDEKHEAMAFLREILRDSEKSAKQVQAEARQNGVSEATLRRAKTALGVKSEKQGGTFGGNPQWVWRLPEETEDAQIEKNDHLQPNHYYKANKSNGLAEDGQIATHKHLQEHLQAKRVYKTPEDALEDAQISENEHLQPNYLKERRYNSESVEDVQAPSFEHLQTEEREVIEI